MGCPESDFFVSLAPKRRSIKRAALAVAIGFLLTGVACCFAVTIVVMAVAKALASIGTDLTRTLCVVAAFCLAPFVIELISLLATGQIVPFVLRVISLFSQR
jgi:hypothetical protein